MPRIIVLVVTMLLGGFSAHASAAVVHTGTVIAQTNHGGWNAANLTNQSGLSHAYVSGVTDFSAFEALNPTHLGTSTDRNRGWYSPAPAVVDFDLGSTLQLTKFALWNDNDFQGVNSFRVFVDDDPSFSSPTLLGSFNATFGPSGYSNPVPMQTFDLIAATGRYVRVNFDTAHSGGNINVGEVIFGAGPTVVPEPASIAIWSALGGIGLLTARRRKRRAANA